MANGTLAASQIEMLSLSGTGIITITPPATNTNRAITLPDAAGAIVVSGTTPSLNGIAFPATQSASADANTLDDYEEGTWTPAYAPSSNSFTSITYGFNAGKYTKIGNMVYVAWRMRTSALTVGSGSGTVLITGLPFTAVANVYFALGIGDAFAVNNAACALVNESNSNISLQQERNNTSIVVTDLSTSSANNFTAGFACYQV